MRGICAQGKSSGSSSEAWKAEQRRLDEYSAARQLRKAEEAEIKLRAKEEKAKAKRAKSQPKLQREPFNFEKVRARDVSIHFQPC